MSTIDPMAPFLDDMPVEWLANIPEEMLARLAPLAGATDPETRALINRIAAGRWFLVRNELRARCVQCGQDHDYITIRCVEAPFSGLRSVLLFWSERPDMTTFLNAMKPGTIVPISEVTARRFNQRIRDRGEQPIHEQRPLRAWEVNADVMRARMWRQAYSLRQYR